MITCPNKSSNDWKLLVKHYSGDEIQAMKVFAAHGNQLPIVQNLGELKKKISFRGRNISDLSRNLMQQKIKALNKINNTSHRVEFEKVSPTSYKAKFIANFFPKYESLSSSNNYKVVNKVASDTVVEKTMSPSDLIVKNGNEYVVNGEVYPSYEDAQNSLYYQSKTSSTSSLTTEEIANLDSFLKKFLSDYGISVNEIDNFKEKYGINAVGVANIAEKVINVAKGKADITTLSEEAAHFIIEMMPEDHALYKAMYKLVVETKEYAEVMKEYGGVYNNNEKKLRKEAMGKILSVYMIEKSSEKTNLPTTYVSLLDKLINAIKKIFGINSSIELHDKLDKVFGRTAEDILSDNSSLGLDSRRLSNKDMYYQLNNMEDALTKVLDKLERQARRLEITSTNEDNENRAALMKRRIRVIREEIDNKQIQSGLTSFLKYMNENELDIILNSMEEFNDSNQTMEYGSEAVAQAIDVSTLYASLLKDIQLALDMPGTNKELSKAVQTYIDETVLKINAIDRFVSTIKKSRIKGILKEHLAENSQYDVDELLSHKIGDLGFMAKVFGPLHAANDEVLRMVYKMALDVNLEAHRAALYDGKDLLALQLKMNKAGFNDMSIFHEKNKDGKISGYVLSDKMWGHYFETYDKYREKVAKELGFDSYADVNYDELTEKQLEIRKKILAPFRAKYQVYSVEDGQYLPKPKVNPDFEKIMAKSQTIRDYYAKIAEVHKKSRSFLPKKYRENERYSMLVPQLRKDIIQTIKDSNEGVLKKVATRFKESFVVDSDDIGFGDVTDDVIIDINGNIVKLIPIHYASPLPNRSSLTNDFTSSYTLFSEMAHKYKGLSARHSDIKLIMAAMGDRQVKTRTSSKKGNTTNAYQALSDFVDMYFYGEEKERIKVKLFSKTYDLTKASDKFTNFVRQNNLFMNIFTAGSGFVKASIDSKIEDLTGMYSSTESKIWAEKEFDKGLAFLLANINRRDKTSKLELMFEHNGVFKNLRETFSRMDIDNRLARTHWNDFIYSSYELLDVRVKGKLALAIYDNFRLVNGKFITKAEFRRMVTAEEASKYAKSNKKANADEIKIHSSKQWNKRKGEWANYADKNLYGAYETKGGRFVVKKEYEKYVTKELENKVNGTIQHRGTTIDGMLNHMDKASINKHFFGRLLMLHRGWLVSGATERFKKKGINYITGEMDEGYYLSTARVMRHMITTEGGIRQKLGSWHLLEDYEKRGVVRMLSDLAFTAAIIVLHNLIQKIVDDDNEDLWWEEAMAFQITRILLEQMAFQNPAEILNILNSPTAATPTIQSILDIVKASFDWDKIEQGPYEGHYRIEKVLIKNSLLKNLFEIQHPKEKNKYIRQKIF